MDERWACPRCEAPAAALEERGPALRCLSCKLVFAPRAAHHALLPAEGPPIETLVGIPDGLSVEETRIETGAPYRDGASKQIGLKMVRKWTDRQNVLVGTTLAMLALMGAGFLLRRKGDYDFLLIMLAFVLVPTIYFALAFRINRTTIELRDGKLRVEHGPIPWWGKREIETAHISQLWCEERVTKNVSSYAVFYSEYGGPPKIFLSDVSMPGEALFIERTLEQALRIRDMPMAGELPK
jgi:hypothetical protein